MPSGLDNLGITNAAMARIAALAMDGSISNSTLTAYPVTYRDNGKYLRFTTAGAVVVTINQDSAGGAVPIGAELQIESAGAGGVTITAGTNVVFHGLSGVLAQFAVRRVRKVAANLYTLY